jgi:hypothetical protein
VPDIEAVPAAERDYYERHGCFQHNNPGLNDLGKDVLFDLITRESGAKMAADMDTHVIAKLKPLIARLDAHIKTLTGEPAKVFTDLRDRVRAYLHWVTSLRNVCAWCENVYGYLDAKSDAATKAACEKKLQAAIDLELANIRGLIELLETTPHEVLVLSGVAENTFFYGENLDADPEDEDPAHGEIPPRQAAHRPRHLLAPDPGHGVARGLVRQRHHLSFRSVRSATAGWRRAGVCAPQPGGSFFVPPWRFYFCRSGLATCGRPRAPSKRRRLSVAKESHCIVPF